MNKTILIISLIVLILIVVVVYFLIQPKQAVSTQQLQTPTQTQNPVLNQSQQTSTSFNVQGMKVEILKQGTGVAAKSGDAIIVNYVGTLINGTKFYSSIDRNQPFTYTLGQNQVIQGWEIGLLGMKVGEERKLIIPPELAYGAAGRPPVIPQNATLIFDVTMLAINGK